MSDAYIYERTDFQQVAVLRPVALVNTVAEMRGLLGWNAAVAFRSLILLKSAVRGHSNLRGVH